jgi:hypothetical protein
MELKTLVNDQGFYGYLDIAVKIVNGEKGTFLTIEKESAQRWSSALKFGLDYFYEIFLRKNRNTGLSVIVRDLNSYDVDSSFSIFFFSWLVH